jgi:hypothetical protein
MAALGDLHLPRSLAAALEQAQNRAAALARDTMEQETKEAATADRARVAAADAAVKELTRAGDFRAAAAELRAAAGELKTDGLRRELEARIARLERAGGYFRRLSIAADRAPFMFQLFPGDSEVQVARLRETSVEFYRNAGDRRAERIAWKEIDPARFAALLAVLAANDADREAAAAAAAELGVEEAQ